MAPVLSSPDARGSKGERFGLGRRNRRFLANATTTTGLRRGPPESPAKPSHALPRGDLLSHTRSRGTLNADSHASTRASQVDRERRGRSLRKPSEGEPSPPAPSGTRRRWRRPRVELPLLVNIKDSEFAGLLPEFGVLKDFIVVNRLTRKIVAEFGTREEAEAFRDGLISAQANGKNDLSIRSTRADSTDQRAGAAQRAEKRRRTARPSQRQRRGPRRPGP
jgi:hypothetical protein